MHTIVIIGSGFSGSLVAVHLLRHAAAGVRIVLIERSGAFGPGLAYGFGSEGLLLNVVAGRMSAFPDEPSHFLEWARRRDASIRGEMFLPRRMFGRYIAGCLDDAARETARESLERLTDEALDVVPLTRGVKVVCRRVGEIVADAVILAPGNTSPARPPWCGEELIGSPRYIHDPWRADELARIGARERILIVGTGLTMMDVTLSLREAGHRGTIDAVSRRGLLSQPHRHGNPTLARLPDPLFSGTFRNVRELLHVLRTAARRAEAEGGDWRDAVNALRPITPALWSALDEHERRRFMEHLLPFWNTHRHRAPQSVADGIESLRNAGTLRVHAARVTRVSLAAHGVEVHLHPRATAPPDDRRVLEVERVINCTGPDADLRRSTDPLLQNLFRSGLVRPGPLNLGLDFAPDARVVHADGSVAAPVYLMGPARIGRLWETTAVPELRVQARDLALSLLRALGAGRTPAAPAVTAGPTSTAGR